MLSKGSDRQTARSGALPKSVLAKACNYTLTLWTRLTRLLEHPELELSNNLAARASLLTADVDPIPSFMQRFA
jgi:hypothetical protein